MTLDQKELPTQKQSSMKHLDQNLKLKSLGKKKNMTLDQKELQIQKQSSIEHLDQNLKLKSLMEKKNMTSWG